MQDNSKNLNSKLILGTVQLGLNYGINNKQGKPLKKKSYKILEYAHRQGICTLDTADAYGDSISTIGSFHKKFNSKFNIATKFKSVSDEIHLSQWLEHSLQRLKVNQLEICSFHSINDYFNNSKLLDELAVLQLQGLVKHIGISIYTNEDFEKVLEDERINVIQLPFNLLDNENMRGSLIRKAKAKSKIIHIRSVFLQGLFFMNLDNLPIKLKPLYNYLNLLQTLCNDLSISMESLALGYVYQNPCIDGVIVGVDTIAQLQSNIKALSYHLPQNIIEEVNKIVVSSPELLSPINWS